MNDELKRPLGIDLIILLHAGSILVTVVGWPLIALGIIPVPEDRLPLSLAWAYGDFLIALPLSVVTIAGLVKMRAWGAWAAVAYSGAVLYATPILVATAFLQGFAPVSLIELPSYPLFVVSAVIPIYLWVNRGRFDAARAKERERRPA